MPIWSIVHWLVVGSSTTLPSASIVGATATTVGYGLVAAALTCLLALPVAFLAVRRRGRSAAVLERAVFLPRALPGLVVGLALVYFTIRYAYGLYQSPYLLVAAYAILFLPLALIAVEPVVAQLTPALEDASRTLGSGPLRTMRRIALPLLAPGLAAAGALVFLTCVTELTATLLLRPTGTETLATQFWVYADGLAYGAAAPFAAMMIGICLVPTYLLARRFHALAA